MNRDERNHLLAERSEVERLLAIIPESQVITRASFESRLRILDQEIGASGVHQEDQTFFGSFLGVLPTSRTFEFQVAEGSSVLCGTIADGVADPSVINRHLNQPIQITLTATGVGEGRRRFVLHQLPAWPAS